MSLENQCMMNMLWFLCQEGKEEHTLFGKDKALPYDGLTAIVSNARLKIGCEK
jgi:hypothetical protein